MRPLTTAIKKAGYRVLAVILIGLASLSGNAATVNLGPVPLQQFNQGGIPCAGCKLFTYAAGTTSKLATYTDATGATPNTNPVILNSDGQASVWLTAGSAYKLVLSSSTDTDPPTSPYWTVDQVFGINDMATLSGSNGSSLIGYLGSLSGMVATTVQAELRQTISIKDYGATCDGSTNDNTAWSALISSIGAAKITVLVPCASKISQNLTFGSGTTLWFTNNGELIGTSGSEVVTTGQGIVGSLHQVFSNLVAKAPSGQATTTTVYPEWWGAVKNGSNDDSGAINSALDYLQNVTGGQVVLSAGNYGLGFAISHWHSLESLVGAGPNSTTLTQNNTAADGIDVTGVAGTPIASPSMSGFNLSASNIATFGINLQYTALARVSDIQVNGFITGVSLMRATNSFVTRVGASYNGATNGFIGFNLNGGGTGAGGNASSVFRDDYVQGFSGTTGKIAFRGYGAFVSDYYFDNCASAKMDYGYEFDYSTATAGGYADVIVVNPVIDAFTQQGILVNAMPSLQMLTIKGGWINSAGTGAETDGLLVTGSSGMVTMDGTQLSSENNTSGIGVSVVNSSHVKVQHSMFNALATHIKESASSYNVYAGNAFFNPSNFIATTMISITGGTRDMVTDNLFDGYSGTGIGVDNTSTAVGAVANTFNPSNITVRISNLSSGAVGGSNGSSGLNSGF